MENGIEGDLLTQVQTHAMETLGPLTWLYGLLTQVSKHMLWRLWGPLTWLYYRGWPANTGPNTCYGDFGPGCIIEGGLLTQVQTHAMERLWGPLTWLYYRGCPANTGPTTMLWRLWAWLYYRGWPANTGPITCYGETLGTINLAVL